MMQANSENSPAIKVITFAQVDLRCKMYSSDFLFEILLESHDYFKSIDRLEFLIDFQKTP